MKVIVSKVKITRGRGIHDGFPSISTLLTEQLDYCVTQYHQSIERKNFTIRLKPVDTVARKLENLLPTRKGSIEM